MVELGGAFSTRTLRPSTHPINVQACVGGAAGVHAVVAAQTSMEPRIRLRRRIETFVVRGEAHPRATEEGNFRSPAPVELGTLQLRAIHPPEQSL